MALKMTTHMPYLVMFIRDALFLTQVRCTDYRHCALSTVDSAAVAILLIISVNIASEMHFDALRSLTQSCMTAYRYCATILIVQCGVLTLQQLSGSADQCILGLVYLRSNL